MEKMKILNIIVVAFVAITCLGVILMPVVNDLSITHKTVENEEIYYMTNEASGLSYELGAGGWEVNGVELQYTGTNVPIIVANDITMFANGRVLGTNIGGNATAAELTVADNTVTGTATVNDTSVSISWDCSEMFYGAVNEGNYAFVATDGAYVLNSSVFSNIASFDVTGNSNFAAITVEVENGEVSLSPIEGVTYSNAVVDWELVSGYVDLYKINSITFDTTYNDTTLSHSFGTVIAPSSVSAEITGHLDQSVINLMGIIPLMFILAILIGIVSAAILRQKD